MPTYEFQCTGCSASFSEVFPFGSTKLPACPTCGKTTRKVIHPPMVHFKGSGFYKTDSGTKSAPKTEAAPTTPKVTPAPATPPTKPS